MSRRVLVLVPGQRLSRAPKTAREKDALMGGAFYLPNAFCGRCVVRTRAGVPCRFKSKFACFTCDVHGVHEEAATKAVEEQRRKDRDARG